MDSGKKYTLLALLILSADLIPQISVGTPYRIFPSSTTQTEASIIRHPLNKNVLFATANTIRFQPSFFVSEGVYRSTDAGGTWAGSDTCNGAILPFHGGDPSITIDYLGRYILTRLGRAPFPGLYAHTSSDSGINWSAQANITEHDLERAIIASDAVVSSPFRGRTYAAWVRFAPPFPVYYSFSTDGGFAWSSPAQVNNPAQRCTGGDITVDKSGVVHLCWAGAQSQTPFIETHTGYGKSTNGGETWTVSENAFIIKGIQGVLSGKQNIRVNSVPRIALDGSGGARNGWIYIVTTMKGLAPAGNDPDIVLFRSTDNGSTWSAGSRVNGDQLNNGKVQFFPAIHVDDEGGVNILYYDDRNCSSDSSGVFLSRSTDGGTSWIDIAMTKHHFKPLPIGGLGQGYQGDNIGITSSGKKLIPLWMDNSSGIYQLWTVPVDINSSSTGEAAIPRNNFRILYNYPNPFNPATNLRVHLDVREILEIELYDMHGQKLGDVFKGELSAGEHTIPVRAHGMMLSSGVYLCIMRVKDRVLTQKIVFQK